MFSFEHTHGESLCTCRNRLQSYQVYSRVQTPSPALLKKGPFTSTEVRFVQAAETTAPNSDFLTNCVWSCRVNTFKDKAKRNKPGMISYSND